MIIGIGTDLAEIDRIEELLGKYSGRFARRAFTEEERAHCDRMVNPGQHYAARFAAKEAFLKAIGAGMQRGVSLKDIEVDRMDSGRPVLRVGGRALELMRGLGGVRAHITMTHAGNHAVATVIIEGESTRAV